MTYVVLTIGIVAFAALCLLTVAMIINDYCRAKESFKYKDKLKDLKR